MLDSIVYIFNAISAAVNIPNQLVCGDIIIIPKKGKDPTIIINHRGITITSVIGKVLEHTLVGRVKNILRDHQHHLQFGFTEKLSPSMAALVYTEVLTNNKDRSQDTFVATVDVQKAFDSVWHDSILRKMFLPLMATPHGPCSPISCATSVYASGSVQNEAEQ